MNINERHFTKCALNFNGASLCSVNSPLRKFSGSSSFYFDNNELLKRSENKHVDTLEKEVFSEKNTMSSLFALDEPVPVPRTYSVNKKIVSRKLYSFFHSKLANKRFYFYTISFPLSTPDNLAYALFNAVLTRLRKGYDVSSIAFLLLAKYSESKSDKWHFAVNKLTKLSKFEQLRHYLWVAERQKNGTIHFHIITSDFVNVLIFNHFVSTYIFNTISKKSTSVNLSHLNSSIYNGVDVSKRRSGLSSVTDIRKYLTKYVTKNTTKFLHYAWHCSRSVSALFTTKEFPVSAVNSSDFPIDANYKSEYYYISDYYTFIFYPAIDFETVFSDMIDLNNDIIDCFYSQ